MRLHPPGEHGTHGSASWPCASEGFDPVPARRGCLPHVCHPCSHSPSALLQPSSPSSFFQGLSLSPAFTGTLCIGKLKTPQVGLLEVLSAGPAESSGSAPLPASRFVFNPPGFTQANSKRETGQWPWQGDAGSRLRAQAGDGLACRGYQPQYNH